MQTKVARLVFWLIFLGLLILPRVVQGNLYFSCCDDTRLYYIYPQKYIENYAINLVADNTWAGANTGYYPGTQMIPMLHVISLLKALVPLNTQYLMYGMNLALAFAFIYLLLGVFIKKGGDGESWIKMVASLCYVFSPFLIRTQYQNQLMSIHLVWSLPASIYFFTRAVLEKKYLFAITSATIFSIFSTGINTLPFFIPIFVTSVPLFIMLFIKNFRSLIINLVIAGVTYLGINIHWLFHFLYSIFGIQGLGGIVGNFSSEEFIEANIKGIIGASTLFSPLNQPLMDLNLFLLQNINLLKIAALVFVGVIVIAGILINRKDSRPYKGIYLLLVSCLLLSWFLISPNFGSWGPQVFLIFATKIPGFTMFRNMFDKFAQPLAFYYAMGLGISLIIIFTAIQKRFFRVVILLFLTTLILYNARTLFVAYNVHEGIPAKISGVFNDDFNALVDYLQKESNPSRVLWLPLNYPTYVSVEDKLNPGHFYSGLSPLRYLANRQDYAGQFSFIIPGDTYLGEKMRALIVNGDYEEVGRIFQLHNARYIIIDKQRFPERMQAFLYGADKSFKTMQKEDFIQQMLGKKLVDFGNRYTVYEINDKYLSERVYLTDDAEIIPSHPEGSSYQKIDSNTYDIHVSNLSEKKTLVLLDPYYSDWSLYLVNDKGLIHFDKAKRVLIRDYANGWEIDPSVLNSYDSSYYSLADNGAVTLKLRLRFKPADFDRYLYPINIGAYLMVGLIHLVMLLKKGIRHAL